MRRWNSCWLCKAKDDGSFEFINICQDCGEAYCDDCFHAEQHDLCTGPPYIRASYKRPQDIARCNGARARTAGKPRVAPSNSHYKPDEWTKAWEAGWDGVNNEQNELG